MAESYIGEIRQVGFNFAPVGWLPCNGQLLQIDQYETLYALIGTTYGGDGQQTFGLPDLRGRAALCQGNQAGRTVPQGELGGLETVTLTLTQIPGHAHPIAASTGTATTASPENAIFGAGLDQYGSAVPTGNTAAMLKPVGGSQAHDNLMPYLCLNYIIATQGYYPSPS